jgi:hypothetical protein
MRRSVIFAGLVVSLAAAVAQSQSRRERVPAEPAARPHAEFHLARVAYVTRGGCGGSRNYCNEWWAIDYPLAEEHILPAVERFTRIEAAPADIPTFVTLNDDALFDYPWIFLQQPGKGGWQPTADEAARLREYLMRGGFLVVDDFHGEGEWQVFEAAIERVLPDRRIVEIPRDDALMNVLFPLDPTIQIPGERHVLGLELSGPPHWRGIYDDEGRLMVAIDYNIDMGDAWEHADDPGYPAEMTGQAYRFGTNFIVYAMTH